MKKATGFTLIEVLVSLVLLSGGLLGLAALQATSLKNNQIAYNRNQATQLAYDMTDRMRVNIDEVLNPATRLPLPNSTYMTLAPNAAASQPDCIAVSATCTIADMAQNDLFEWNNAIALTLPNGTGSITVDAAQVFTITITWTENSDRNNDGTIDVNDVVSFQTGFQL
ncbi:MAG: type IV pilus modification protein PilV [Methylovulum sp.]|nr:type IV pilus modification protein PilV [Methylovulum sp.]